MGSKPAPAPVTYIPEPQVPTVFRSVVPEEDFERATQYIQDLKTEREAAKAERYAEIGTPKEIGQRMKERDTKIETAYLDSLPGKEIDYTAGLQPSILNNIENFLQDLPSSRLGKSKFSGFKPGESATKVDPVPNIRNIESQIVNRRADEANLNRPEGTAQYTKQKSLEDISKRYGQYSTFGHKDYEAARQEGYSSQDILNWLNEDLNRLHERNRPGGPDGLYDEISRGEVDLSKKVDIDRGPYW